MPAQDPLLTESLKVVDKVIAQIEHLPNGYTFWRTLPPQGKTSVGIIRKRWGILLRTTFFPPSFIRMLLCACLNAEGVPDRRGVGIYQWLLKYVYRNNVKALYADWLQWKKEEA